MMILPLALAIADTVALPALEQLIPATTRTSHVLEAPRLYPGDKIYTYMDGAGEIYLAYKFQNLLVQRYTGPARQEILVELFDMGLARHAFGVFTYMKGRGPSVPVGQEGEYKSGLLSFWKGRYFACVMVEEETSGSREAVLELGQSIAGAIRDTGDVPDIVRLLPEGSYQPASLRYFTRHEILNIHFYIADGNLLHLDGNTEGVLARTNGDGCYLLLIRYAGQDAADSAHTSFMTHYMPEARGTGTVKTENGKWTTCSRSGRYFSAVFDAPSEDAARQMLTNLQRRLP